MPASSGRGQHRVADLAARADHQVDHAGRQAGRHQHPHDEVRRVDGGRGRLPQHGVAHHRRRGRQVAADRGEVERRHREDEPLEGAVLDAVPHARRGDRLVLVDLLHEVGVEAPEVDELAGGVDLGLEDGLGLAEHGGRVGLVAARAGEQVGGLQEDRGAVVPRHRATTMRGPRARPPSPSRPRPSRPCGTWRGRGRGCAGRCTCRASRCGPPRRR